MSETEIAPLARRIITPVRCYRAHDAQLAFASPSDMPIDRATCPKSGAHLPEATSQLIDLAQEFEAASGFRLWFLDAIAEPMRSLFRRRGSATVTVTDELATILRALLITNQQPVDDQQGAGYWASVPYISFSHNDRYALGFRRLQTHAPGLRELARSAGIHWPAISKRIDELELTISRLFGCVSSAIVLIDDRPPSAHERLAARVALDRFVGAAQHRPTPWPSLLPHPCPCPL